MHPVAAVDPDAAAQRTSRVPLLRPVRTRLRDAFELLVALGAAAARAQDRPAARSDRGDGARSDDRSERQGHGRLVHRQGDRRRPSRARKDRRARGERVRESRGILLNSKSAAASQRPLEFRGALGRYLTDSTGSRVSGFVPKLMDMPPHNEDGVGGMHLYMPWWLDNKKLDFPRGYHIEIWGGRGMPAYGFGGGIRGCLAAWRRLRQAAEGRLPPLLRRARRLRRPRRDGAERRHLLRDRSQRRGQVRHPGAALPLEVERSETEAGQAHAGDLPRRSSSRWAARPTPTMPGADEDYGTRGGRPDHPRGGRDADGEGSGDVSPERVVPGARSQERRSSATGGRSSRTPTRTHVDDPGAGLAHERRSSGRACRRGTCSHGDHADATRSRSSAPTPVAAGVALGEAAAAGQAMASGARDARRRRRTRPLAAKGPYKPKFFTAHECATVTVLGDLIIPKDEQSGSATDAGVPEFIDFTMTDRPTTRRPSAADCAGSTRNRASGSARRSSTARRRTGRRSSTTSRARRRAKPELEQGAAFFYSSATSPRRLLVQQDRHRRFEYMGNRPNQWNGCPPECLDHLGLKA